MTEWRKRYYLHYFGCTTDESIENIAKKLVKNYKDESIDFFFIDGDHSYKQSLKDVENSLCRLSENGVIIMHDVNPSRRYMQVEPKPDIAHKWCGGCWKTFAKLRMTRPNLWMAMIPDDLGCGIIKFGKQICYPTSPLNWNLFTEHKQELMNIITVDQLKEMSFKH
jgi:hypothetical protein